MGSGCIIKSIRCRRWLDDDEDVGYTCILLSIDYLVRICRGWVDGGSSTMWSWSWFWSNAENGWIIVIEIVSAPPAPCGFGIFLGLGLGVGLGQMQKMTG